MQKLDGELKAQAQRYLTDLHGDILSGTTLSKVSRSLGPDFAAMLFYQSVLHSRRDKDFIRHLNQIKISSYKSNADFEIALVPSSFAAFGVHQLKENEISKLRGIWRQLGFKTEVIETSHELSLSENAQRIGHYLAEASARHVILLSQGRGSAEVRLLLQKLGARTPEFKKLKGWISTCGTLAGSSLLARHFSPAKKSWAQKTWPQKTWQMAFWGKGLAALEEASVDNSEWSAKFELPQTTSFVQIQGVSRRPQLSLDLKKGFDQLTELGPSDGFHLLSETHLAAGLCYPVWGLNPSSDLLECRGVIERALLMMTEATHANYAAQFQQA